MVLDDADLRRVVEVGVAARWQDSGQSCIAAKRFLVQAGDSDRFRDALVARMSEQKLGDPRAERTAIGPLAQLGLHDLLVEPTADALSHGARLLGEGPQTEPTGARGVVRR